MIRRGVTSGAERQSFLPTFTIPHTRTKDASHTSLDSSSTTTVTKRLRSSWTTPSFWLVLNYVMTLALLMVVMQLWNEPKELQSTLMREEQRIKTTGEEVIIVDEKKKRKSDEKKRKSDEKKKKSEEKKKKSDEKKRKKSDEKPASEVSTLPFSTTSSNSKTVLVNKFDDHCYMTMGKDRDSKSMVNDGSHDKHFRQLAEDDLQEDDHSRGVGPVDAHRLGPCFAEYPQRIPPPNGYLEDIDWFHFRDEHTWRDACYLFCIDQLPPAFWQTEQIRVDTPHSNDRAKFSSRLLIQAVIMGLPRTVEKLLKQFNMDPLQVVDGNDDEMKGSNAIQMAIRSGNAEILAQLTNSNSKLIIDDLGRTVEDYMRLKGSPIRPIYAKQSFHIDTTRDQNQKGIRHFAGSSLPEDDEFAQTLLQNPGQGWNQQTAWPVSERCDIDIIYGSMSRQDFYNDYFLPGRPFVLRGIIPKEEIEGFAKQRWQETKRYHPSQKFSVGPTAYPSLTGQEKCEEKMSIQDMEVGAHCEEMPKVPILHAWHPTDKVCL